MEETWKRAVGFPTYEVSNLGRVRSRYGRIIKHTKLARRKTVTVQLSGQDEDGTPWRTNRSVAMMVINAFTAEADRGRVEIGYKDGDWRNVRLDNLYVIRESSLLASMGDLPKQLDDEAAIALFAAICDQAIADIARGMRHPTSEGKRWAEDARRFFKTAYWIYIGEAPDAWTMNQIARRVETFKETPGKKKTRSNAQRAENKRAVTWQQEE